MGERSEPKGVQPSVSGQSVLEGRGCEAIGLTVANDHTGSCITGEIHILKPHENRSGNKCSAIGQADKLIGLV